MTIQETYLTPFINGVQTMAERFIQISQFDKTITAEILEVDEHNAHHYLVSTTGCQRFSVYSFETDTTNYKIKDTVYITIPNGDFSSPDKYIIGKTNKQIYKSSIQKIEDILVCPYNTTTDINQTISNANRYSTLIIEFIPKIECNIINADKINLILQETVFPFTINGVSSNFWSTRNLYGNIFNDLVPCPQRIVITGLRDVEQIQIAWESLSQIDIPILSYDNQETGNTAKVTLENMNYYYGYSKQEFNENEVNGVTIILTHNGPKLFCRNSYYFDNFLILNNELGADAVIDFNTYNTRWPNQSEAFSYICDLQEKNIDITDDVYNDWNSFPVELQSLSSLYSWSIEAYNRDYTLKTQEKKYVPPFWKLTKTYNTSSDNFDSYIFDQNYFNTNYKNSLACLVCQWYDCNDYAQITQWYDEQYKELAKNTDLSYEEYVQEINKLGELYQNKY